MPKGGKRLGAGRPSTGRTEEERVYLSPKAKAKLSAIAKAQKVPKGQIVENLLISEKTMQIQVNRTVEFADQTKLNGGSCVNLVPGTYTLELVTLENPAKPWESAEFYRVQGTKAVISQKGLEMMVAESLTVKLINEDVKGLGQLINSIVDINVNLTILTMPQLAVAIQLACAYFNLRQDELKRFEGKTGAYRDLRDAFGRLQSPKPLPLVDLLDVLDSLIRGIRDLEEFCGIPHEEEYRIDQ